MHGPMDQGFALRPMCEKYLANGKDVWWAFLDLEKACMYMELKENC